MASVLWGEVGTKKGALGRAPLLQKKGRARGSGRAAASGEHEGATDQLGERLPRLVLELEPLGFERV